LCYETYAIKIVACGGTVGWGTAPFPIVSLEFFFDYDPGVYSASNRNEYQVRMAAQTYHLQVSIVSKSGYLNLLAPSRPCPSMYRDCLTRYKVSHK